MAYKLGVLVVHGMGSQGPEFAQDMIEELQRRVRRPGAVCYRAAVWADLLSGWQDELWQKMRSGGRMKWKRLREFVISHFGDAIAYQRVPGQRRDVYGLIHQRIHEHVAALRSELGGEDRPLVVMAHSLGAHIMSNYIWDRQHRDKERYNSNAFESMQTLAGIVTFGCNIPLFSLAYEEMICIEFPPRGLASIFPNADPGDVAAAAQWLNFFDPDDVFGYPLKTLSDSYQQSVIQDIAINTGGLLHSWNPASHARYWTDNDLTKPAAALVRGLLQLLD